MDRLKGEYIREIVDKVFDRSKDIELVDYGVTETTDVLAGFMSASKKLWIRVSRAGEPREITCFVKFMPDDNPFHREYILNSGGFVKEPFFYNTIASDMCKFSMEKCMPRCYLSRENEVLVLEDLTNYKTKDMSELFSLEEMKAAVKALAIFHSSSMIFESKYNVRLDKICEGYLFETLYRRKTGHFGLMHMQAGIKAFRAIVDKHFTHLDSETKEFAFTTYYKIPELIKPSTKHRNVIIHADLYTNNIMFSRERDQINACLIDFQLIRYNPPAMDLTIMIHLNSSKEFREKHLTSLVDFYYATIKNCLESYGLDASIEFPQDDFYSSFHETELPALAITSLFQHYVFLPPDRLRQIMTESTMLKKFLLDDRNDVVLAAYENSQFYREKLFSSINDFMDACKRVLKKS